MARPVWTPTDAQRRQAETMAAYGIPEADIARVLGVSKPTLRKHCGTELDTGATRANSKVADFLFYGICGGTGKPAFKDERARVTAAIFWMKTRGGWSETSTHKHTGVANGDPIWPSMLLITFIAHPCPIPPTWNTFLPIARNRSWLAAKVSARPPTITDRVAAAAPCVPPLTGASSMVTPLAPRRSAKRRAASGSIVLMQRTMSPCLADWIIPFSPRITDSA